ncbi:urate oxidase [Actinocrinis puniceicyclus]|uniref:Uricase n=1 Tax=Actinocrinis puniceicyclus TaxID=977794 RepID=A0A8J7WTP6_9ACTN|nr:urate oxidase [Actinocrinis puniceicyclus]MBS2964999.1 urate oxidase [Actinocrinis puniceicyclus]
MDRKQVLDGETAPGGRQPAPDRHAPAVVLGPTRYGKAEVRIVRVTRGAAEHALKDLNVSIALSGDQADTHLTGDNAKVLTTDAQKNAVYALAKRHGVASAEQFALLLAQHFLTTCPYITHARIGIEEYGWDRIPGAESRHSFVRGGRETRTALVHADADGASRVVSGLKDLVVLNTAGSEFHGFYEDEYTTLAETSDRVLATAIDARWRRGGAAGEPDWDKSYARARAALMTAFADTHSLSLQQTLYAMGRRLLEHDDAIAEARLTLPNRHHVAVDLAPFGLTNDNEVFHAADRPYGLIEGSLARRGEPPDPAAWQ